MHANRAMLRVREMARLLGVSRSGYYAWRGRGAGRREQADERLKVEIAAAHAASRGTYGAPRIRAELAARGIRTSRKRVARLMRALALRGVSRRRRVRTTPRDAQARPAPDLVDRDFVATALDHLWVADITYIPTLTRMLHLAVGLDACSRRVVGWAMAVRARATLVVDALEMAIEQRQPRAVIHHSDQGCQYTSVAFGRRCRAAGGAALHGFGRGLLRQRDGRVLLRHPRVRAARPNPLPEPEGGRRGGLRVHRGLVQPSPATLRPRLPVARRLRTTTPGAGVNRHSHWSDKLGQAQRVGVPSRPRRRAAAS